MPREQETKDGVRKMALNAGQRSRLKTALGDYFASVKAVYATGQAREHAYRPAQITLFNAFDDVLTINDAAKSEAGFPDFTFLKKSNHEITRGYGEGKDLGANLNQIEKTDQLIKYGAYSNLLLTNVIEFRFFSHGEPGPQIRLASVSKDGLAIDTDSFDTFIDEFVGFLEQPPEKIRSAKRLAEIMGGKARRIRAFANRLLEDPSLDANRDVQDVYELVRKTLSHDMEPDDFADMYAQTLVYGLFAARYHDPNLETFSRQEARDLIAHESDFLKHFFDHIAGVSFPSDLRFVVNELTEVLRVSDVKKIVSAHLKAGDNKGRDPIIYFYELFLSEYDAEQRKDRGVYYTPTPVVHFIVRSVDTALRQHLGVTAGLADAQKKKYAYKVDAGYMSSKDKRTKGAALKQERTLHRVQILDPAVGTATFLNETVRHIHGQFVNQEGMWPAYVKDDLLPRLHGFELMMAPYSIAHIKLAMTLGELGVTETERALGVYLTNTLDQSVELDHDLFTIGLASAFTAEATKASEIKTETPIMVVMGNPPYSGHSENKSVHAKALVERYKVEPGGKSKLQERNPKWINDDYVKFIAFAEQMVAKNADGGVMAMITNNGYLDNPTFRGMRWHLANTFDTIYVLDLHGSLKKKEKALDGGKDENVFDIQQGVAIIVAVKTGNKNKGAMADVFHADLYGTRAAKFKALDSDDVTFEPVTLDKKFYFFQPRDSTGQEEYQTGIPVNDFFKKGVIGLFTGRDKLTIDIEKDALWKRVNDFIALAPEDARTKYALGKDVRDWAVARAQADVSKGHSKKRVIPVTYRPFDVRWTYYTGTQRGFYYYPRLEVMKDLRDDPENLALVIGRQGAATGQGEWTLAYVARHVIDLNIFSRGGGYVFPRRCRDDAGDWQDNIADSALARVAKALTSKPDPDDVFSYVYGVLNSPAYRSQAKEFLKSDYPIIPMPKDDDDFRSHVEAGKRLQALHLLEAKELQDPANFVTTYPVPGDNVVGKRKHDGDKLWINETQYIGNVSAAMWEYQIGGYPVAEKWLKDRRGRALSADEIRHIQRVLTAITMALEATASGSNAAAVPPRRKAAKAKVAKGSRRAKASAKEATTPPKAADLSKADRDAIRKWSRSRAAKKAGVDPVGARGRIPTRAIEAWKDAQ